MAEMPLIDSLKSLRTLIDQQHLLYLELDENPRKIDQREKLEGYIKDYLCLAPHDLKFTFKQTAEVLHQSASSKNNFSAYKAAVAWKAIGKYADNLISHPWRKEYKEVKLYCGFYKHEVEENLVGAESVFEAMGYRHSGHSSMAMPGIIDPDRLTSVSKDAIVAFVECQIMKQIWEMLSSHFNITWFEILEFRENHSGTPDQVIRALTYKHRQRHYQEQYYQKPHYQSADSQLLQSECAYMQHTMGYYNHPTYQGQFNIYPNHNRFSSIINSPVYHAGMPHSYSANNQVLKPQDIYPINSYHMHSHYLPSPLPHLSQNGYSMVPVMYPVPSVVPTGQLIELDPSPPFNTIGEGYFQKSLLSGKCQNEVLHTQDCLKNDGPTLTSKGKDDGAGSWENWDYVFRNLESQRNKKDLELMRESIQKSTSSNNSSDVDESDYSETLRKLNLDLSCQRLESDSVKSRLNADVGTKEKEKIEEEILKEERIKTEFRSKLFVKKDSARKSSEVSTSSKGSGMKENEYPSTSKEGTKLKKSKEETKNLVVDLEVEEEKWQCFTCTYLNSLSVSVCEMCYKSRERGNELNPQPSGGAECPKCTLVNEPGLANCAACAFSLKDSPTYI